MNAKQTPQPRFVPDGEFAHETRPEAETHSEAETGSEAETHFAPDTGRRLKKAALVFAAVLAVLFIAVRLDRFFKDRAVAQAAEQASTAPHLVDVIQASPVGAVQRLSLPGQTAAWHSSTIYARVNGYVGKWFVDIGDHVKKGQVMALIETPDLDAQLAGARAQLQAAEAQVLVRRAQAEFSKTTYERWRDSPKGVVSEQEREEKRADYDSAVATLKAAEADVTLDQARVNQYVALSEFKQVTAPYDGVVSQRDIDIGNLVTAGSTSATTPLYVMTQNDPMRIFVDVPQSAAADLMGGQIPVEVQVPGAEGHTYAGSVTRTAQAINQQARTLRVEVDIPNARQGLVPGMYVRVGFSLQPKGLVQIPAAALVFRSGGPQVARVDKTGHISFRNVTIARDDGNVVELASGVAAGDDLALNVSNQIGEGDLVQVNRAEQRVEPPRGPQQSATTQSVPTSQPPTANRFAPTGQSPTANRSVPASQPPTVTR
ncbi:MAG TPA: efflux RND transporter periplasmic adaptor subunit [Steroidobacteraceae bacterium]|nr:efflux RND transporter periplasmic adaptor subunit [Steroidobacteraceae bacterium]